MKLIFRIFAFSCIAAVALRAAGQVPVPPSVEPDQNRRLLIKLDRTKVRAFEPVFVCLTAEQFAAGHEVEVLVSRGGEAWRSLSIPKKDWDRSETPSFSELPLQRRGAILHVEEINGTRNYIFPEAGEYKVKVKIGPDSTTLSLTVTPPEAGEQLAWDTLVERVTDVLQNNFADQPEQGTIDLCAKVMRNYPKTMAAAYCQSYISITRFKVLFEKNERKGGKAVYGEIANELAKIATAFHETFFGEMTAFYAAYAKGLAKDYPGLLAVADDMKTHLTVWGDAVIAMKIEVINHTRPRVIPVDPDQPIPTTEPTTAPTTAPIIRFGSGGLGNGN